MVQREPGLTSSMSWEWPAGEITRTLAEPEAFLFSRSIRPGSMVNSKSMSGLEGFNTLRPEVATGMGSLPLRSANSSTSTPLERRTAPPAETTRVPGLMDAPLSATVNLPPSLTKAEPLALERITPAAAAFEALFSDGAVAVTAGTGTAALSLALPSGTLRWPQPAMATQDPKVNTTGQPFIRNMLRISWSRLGQRK